MQKSKRTNKENKVSNLFFAAYLTCISNETDKFNNICKISIKVQYYNHLYEGAKKYMHLKLFNFLNKLILNFTVNSVLILN